jgi:hypothetical protein
MTPPPTAARAEGVEARQGVHGGAPRHAVLAEYLRVARRPRGLDEPRRGRVDCPGGGGGGGNRRQKGPPSTLRARTKMPQSAGSDAPRDPRRARHRPGGVGPDRGRG